MQYDLEALLSAIGHVNRVEIFARQATSANLNPCYALVSFADRAAASRAIQERYLSFPVQNLGYFSLSVKAWNGPSRVCSILADSTAVPDFRRRQLQVGNIPSLSEKVRTDLVGIFRRYGIIQDIVLQSEGSANHPVYTASITFEKEKSVALALNAGKICMYRSFYLDVTAMDDRKPESQNAKAETGNQQKTGSSVFINLFITGRL
jgi:hypothetical protein